MKEKKLICEYKEMFGRISALKKHDEYKKIKEAIKNSCKANTQYYSLEYIHLEIERTEEELENKKSPYVSIFMALFAVTLSLLIPNLIDFVNASSKVTKNNSYDNSLFILVMCIYIIGVLYFFGIHLRKKEREFKCYIVYKKVLEELKQEIELNG